jgi:hypothetical protein
VFIEAVSTDDRRRLRFALPRLAREGDPIAIDYAFAALRTNSIDAPRIVHYLSSFLSDTAVAERVGALGIDPDVSEWVLMRIVPLLCRISLDEVTLSAIAKRAGQTNSSLLWGLLIRVLSVHGSAIALDMLRRPENIRDHRAAAAAFLDLGYELPLSMETPATTAAARALEHLDESCQAPLPKVESLL